jgi:hypothetical protein
MESRFGHNFANVRVHADAQADESAQTLHARAYTVGRHVVFKAGQYSPGTSTGTRLLAHELAHCIQQSRGGPPPTLDPSSPLEQAAHTAARGAQGNEIVNVSGMSGIGVAREEDDEDPTELRGKDILERYEERAHDPSQAAELEEERTTRRSGGSERARHKTRSLDVELHHGFPKFLGGNRIQTYIKLTNELHYLYHQELYHLLESEFNKRNALPEGAGPGSRKYYGRIFERLNPTEQQAILDEIIKHAEGFDARYRKADPAKNYKGYPDKRQRLSAALRRGIKDAQAETKPQQPKKQPAGPAVKPATRLKPTAGAKKTTQKPVTISDAAEVPAKPTAVTPVDQPKARPTALTPGEGGATRNPTGGATPGSTSTSGAGGGQSTTGVKAEVGAPIKPVVEATPGFRPVRGAGFGGAFQIAQAMQVANLQGAEVAKYLERHAKLQPKIEAWLMRGYSVELILIVEQPNSREFACVMGQFCDQSQLNYFHDLYINRVERVRPVGPVTPNPPSLGAGPFMGAVDERQAPISDLIHRDNRPLPSQGGSFTDEKEIRSLPTRDPGHHCEYAKQTLNPVPAFTESEQPGGQAGDEMGQVGDVPGTYSLKFEKLFSGPLSSLSSMMMGRQLQIEQDPSGKLVPKMWDLSETYSYLPYAVDNPRKDGRSVTLRGRFSRDKGFPKQFDSTLVHYPRLKPPRILEWVNVFNAEGLTTETGALKSVFNALFTWWKT